MELQDGGAQGQRLDEVAEEIEFLVRSPDRIRLMSELLADGERTRDELRAAADTSRTTVQRNLDALEDRGWISNRGRTYTISPCGKLVATGVLDLVETAGMASELQEFLQWTSLEDLDLDPRLLADSDVTVVDPGDPYAPVNRHVESLEDADHYRLLLPSIGLDAMKTSHAAVMAGEQSGEAVLHREPAEAAASKPEYEPLFADLVECPRSGVFVTGEEIPFYLGIVDDVVQIGVEDDDGVPRALAESTDDEVREWARETFAAYRERATEVSDASMEELV